MKIRPLIRQIFLVALFALFMGFASIFLILNNELLNKYADTPTRPKNVPEQAVWAGGFSGGDFIYCRVDIIKNRNHCVIYADVTGAIQAEADFYIKDEKRAATAKELSYDYFDGQNIKLENGKILIPERPIIYRVLK